MGKTDCGKHGWRNKWKHPHGRGEDTRARASSLSVVETPPRAWGRHARRLRDEAREGNTPTGVGKTTERSENNVHVLKHPHGRGEDRLSIQAYSFVLETPPRAWGRLPLPRGTAARFRNTPTGVGKTRHFRARPAVFQKHPHGRGEDCCAVALDEGEPETPPRAWGRLSWRVSWRPYERNTPTGVGKTVIITDQRSKRGKHPHGRGED